MPALDNIKHLIEALRGGNSEDTPKPAGPSSSDPVIRTQLRGYQLHRQEAAANGESPMSYSEWLKQHASQ